MNLKKTVACSLITASFAGALAFSSTKEVHASSGTVYIQEGNKMTGMQVHVEGGRSGWAYWRHKFGNQYEWSYDTQGKKWKADVGVNGTLQSWAINARGFNWTYRQGNNIPIWVNQGGHYGWRTVLPRS